MRAPCYFIATSNAYCYTDVLNEYETISYKTSGIFDGAQIHRIGNSNARLKVV